jgi:CRISPR system Cascade subunit CasB
VAQQKAKSEGSPPLSSIIGRLAAVISSENFPTGDRAALKRLTPGKSPPLTAYRFAFRYLPDGWEKQESTWMSIVAGLALMCPTPHRKDRPAGRALAEAGYSEARFERLLAAEGEVLQTLTLRAARFLAAKGESTNWVDLAELLLGKRGGEAGENLRLRLARDYYYNLREKE